VERIAVIGTGIIGSCIARRQAAAGRRVTVWNRTRAKAEALAGERIAVAETPAVAAGRADAVAVVVADDAAVEAVLSGPDGVLAGLEAGALVLDMTTTGAAGKRRFAERVHACGARAVEAPFFGSRPQAEAGELCVLVGGREEDAADAGAFLAPVASEIVHAGPIGAGAALKLAGNLLIFTMVAGLAETLALAEAQGVEPGVALAVLGRCYFRSPLYELKGRQMLEGDFAPRGSLTSAVKDFGLIREAAAVAGLRLPCAETVSGVFAAAAAERTDEDIAAVYRHVAGPRSQG
jgi:3-hydroxyisobutyrate dehydrogenase/2-hydroxy-3-oxopropionate reductase